MKVIFEFDTESENFNSIELERHKQADDMAKALGEILKKARGWDKYDERIIKYISVILCKIPLY